MKTLILTDVSSGNILDRITLAADGTVSYETDAGRSLIENLVTAMGITPAEAFEMRTGWSNGYVVAKIA